MSKLSGKTTIFIAAAALLLLLVILFLWPDGESDPAVPVPEPVAETSPAEPSLPALEESDAFVWQEISQLADLSGIARWRGVDYLLQRTVGIVASAAEGRVVRKQLEVFGPDAPFPVLRKGNDLYMDPAGYRRFDGLAQFAGALDAERTVAAYRGLEPLVREAYRQLGRQEPVLTAVQDAIVKVLQAPLVQGDIQLLRKSVVYSYQDPALESLDPIARQMIRMGPDNTRIIQKKLQEIKELL